MKLHDYLKQFEGLDPETEILHGDPGHYERSLNKAIDSSIDSPVSYWLFYSESYSKHYKKIRSEESLDFREGKTTKAIFLV